MVLTSECHASSFLFCGFVWCDFFEEKKSKILPIHSIIGYRKLNKNAVIEAYARSQLRSLMKVLQFRNIKLQWVAVWPGVNMCCQQSHAHRTNTKKNVPNEIKIVSSCEDVRHVYLIYDNVMRANEIKSRWSIILQAPKRLVCFRRLLWITNITNAQPDTLIQRYRYATKQTSEYI